VADNGLEFRRENMTRIFNLGFTTKKKTARLWPCTAAPLAAKELGGKLVAFSDGPESPAPLSPGTACPKTNGHGMNVNPNNKPIAFLVIDDNKDIHEDFRKILTAKKKDAVGDWRS